MKYIDRFPAGVYLLDFEFHPSGGVEGNIPMPVCLVVRNYLTGVVLQYRREQLMQMSEAPYPCGDDALSVAFFACAEMDCFLSLGWKLPTNVLDLFCEFRKTTNGLKPKFGNGLIGALLYFDFPAQEQASKDQMRDLILGGGPWSEEQEKAILNYCQTDVDALRPLLAYMYPMIDWPRALLRGEYMKAVSKMQSVGVPIDVDKLDLIRKKWDSIQDLLIARIDQEYKVFEGRTFKASKWAQFLERNRIPWPRLESGGLDLKDETFRSMAKAHPKVAPMRELRSALSELRLSQLSVGKDGRNRCLLSPFASKTARNQPSNSRFIFGPSVWLRGLIKPQPGWAVVYIDYCQQEFGIAAALSGDEAMMEAYLSGDPYLAFAKQAGAAPANATKVSHKAVREQFKQCVLAVQYGMGEESLAERIGQPPIVARRLLELHRNTYRRFWTWSDAVLDEVSLHGRLWTSLGWEIRVSERINPRSMRNFPMQANGAEMLRLASIYLTDAEVRVCAPVHDALLIEATVETLADTVKLSTELMIQASRDILSGFALSCDTKIIQHPDRFIDERGEHMWNVVLDLAQQEDPLAASPGKVGLAA